MTQRFMDFVWGLTIVFALIGLVIFVSSVIALAILILFYLLSYFAMSV